jgi:hypothetical protein
MKCPQCGSIANISTTTFCSDCGCLLSSATTKTRFNASTLLWETNHRRFAFFKVLNRTVAQFLFHPDKWFSEVAQKKAPIAPAWQYGLIIGSIGLLGSWFWTIVLRKYSYFAVLHYQFFNQELTSPLTLIAAPLLISLQFFLITLYAFVMLRLNSRNKVSFLETFRIICYAETPTILQVIPIIGTLLSIILWIFALLTGLHYLYGMSRGKVLFILLLPFLILFAFVMIIVIAGIIGGIIAGTGLSHEWWSLIR